MVDHGKLMAAMAQVDRPATLLIAISPAERSQLIAAAADRQHQTAVSVAYGPWLRASEVAC